MPLILGVIVLLMIVVLMVWQKKRRASGQASAGQKSVDPRATTSRFHSVAIRPGPNACEAARALEGQRFLSASAPLVPLPSCDSPNCQCRFVHYADRRSGEDRRSPYPATIGIETGAHRKEQRQPGDRRKKPPASWG